MDTDMCEQADKNARSHAYVTYPLISNLAVLAWFLALSMQMRTMEVGAASKRLKTSGVVWSGKVFEAKMQKASRTLRARSERE